MNRRQFLQTLASLGASFSIPAVLQTASAAQVDEAWVEALANPWFFEVGEFGAIVEPGVPEPRIRSDVFSVWDREPRDPEHLISEVEGIEPLASAFQGLAADEGDELDPDDGWKALVRRDGKAGIDRYWEFIERWLDEPIDWGESDWFPSDWHGQGKALAFFQGMDGDTLHEIGVVIVEGDCPGSSYFAAELRNELEDANAAAQRLGLPFRFRAEGRQA